MRRGGWLDAETAGTILEQVQVDSAHTLIAYDCQSPSARLYHARPEADGMSESDIVIALADAREQIVRPALIHLRHQVNLDLEHIVDVGGGFGHGDMDDTCVDHDFPRLPVVVGTEVELAVQYPGRRIVPQGGVPFRQPLGIRLGQLHCAHGFFALTRTGPCRKAVPALFISPKPSPNTSRHFSMLVL